MLFIALGIVATLVIDWFKFNPLEIEDPQDRTFELWVSWPLRLVLIIVCLALSLQHYGLGTP